MSDNSSSSVTLSEVQKDAARHSAHMTVEDLSFLVYNKVALRFQHKKYEDSFIAKGGISGDAYSLAYPKAWYPPTSEKAREFEESLEDLVSTVFSAYMSSYHDYDGCFSLIRDVAGAHSAVTYRSYKGPFYPVGAFTKFRLEQRIGKIDISNEDIITNRGWNRIFNPEQVAIRAKIISDIKTEIISQISKARLEFEALNPNIDLEHETRLLDAHIKLDL